MIDFDQNIIGYVVTYMVDPDKIMFGNKILAIFNHCTIWVTCWL